MMAEPKRQFVPSMAVRAQIVPENFEEYLIANGRLACEAYFHAPRALVDAWLRRIGKPKTETRAETVKARIQEQRSKRINRKEMGAILHHAFPASNEVDPAVARAAAQYLRISRNGGHTVSPMMSGGWMVGIKRVSSEELIEMARQKGFDQ